MANADARFILREGHAYRVRIHQHGVKVPGGTYPTLEEAQRARDTKLAELAGSPIQGDGFTSCGVVASETLDEAEVWARAEAEYARLATLEARRRGQTLTFPGPLACLVFAADQHLGGPGVDYGRVLDEARLIAETAGMYVCLVGDLVDNFVVDKLRAVRMSTRLSIADELALLRFYLQMLAPRIVGVVGGNHEAWTEQLAGFDYTREVVGQIAGRALYDPDQLDVTVQVADWAVPVRVRHKWRGSSIYNPTHGIERAARFDGGFRVGVGAHTHRSGLAREFTARGETCLAVLCGTYKVLDRFARQQGFERANDSTAVAVLFDARERAIVGVGSVTEAARVLRGVA